MDLTAQALVDPDLYRRTLEPLLADDDFAAIVLGIIQTDQATAARKFPFIIDAVKAISPNKPVIFAGLDDGAEFSRDYVAGLREIGVPYFPSADRVFRALRHLSRLAERDFAAGDAAPYSLSDLPVGTVPEYRAKQLLGPAGIPFPKGGFAANLDNAKAVAAEVGYPVVLKAQAAALSHKSDAGGVILGIADDAALSEAWSRLYANVEAYSPGLKLDGALIEGMGARGTELIIGAKNDPEWGPVILVGFGGVQAELLKDVRLLPHDLSREAINAELRALKSGAILDGFRGSPALDVDAVADVVAALGSVLAGTPAIREIDLNPVVVYPKGQGAVALDALILADG
jgi:acyl-CoA synthetase (NDP forming)